MRRAAGDLGSHGVAALERAARYLERVFELPYSPRWRPSDLLNGRYALRLAVGNMGTAEQDLRTAWEVLRREAQGL